MNQGAWMATEASSYHRLDLFLLCDSKITRAMPSAEPGREPTPI
jgi:hypothetical protein